MAISLKNYVYRLQNDLQLIAVKIEQGDYDGALKHCDEWLSSSALFLKPLSSATYFQCGASLLYLKSQALMAKMKLFTVESDKEAETLWEELDKTVKACASYFYYSGWIYRRKLKPQFDMLIADFRYLDEEEYEFKEWFIDCLVALEKLKKRHGKKNKLAYGEALVYVAKTVIELNAADTTLRTWGISQLSKALNIYKKYDPNNINKIAQIGMLIKAKEITSEGKLNADSLSELSEARIKKINDDSQSKLEVEQTLYSQNYLLAIQNLQANNMEEASAYAKCAIEHGRLYLNQLQSVHSLGLTSQQILQGLTIMAMILFQCKKDESHLLSMIELWEELVAEIQSKNRENRHAYFANMTDGELSENITIKDVMAHLGSGIFNYNSIEASLALNAQINIGLCYILLGDIRRGVNCKDEVEKILRFNDDIFDNEIAALITYPMYINLYLYYRQHQTKEAEKYNQLCIKLRNTLNNSEYCDQISVYDQLFEGIYKSIS